MPQIFRLNWIGSIRKKVRLIRGRIRSSKFKDSIILIYSMGKVGSSSVFYSLQRRLPFAAIHHVHFLSDYWLKERLKASDAYFHGNIKTGNDIRDYIRRNPARRLKIITLVREPIGRDISGIFENQAAFFGSKDTISIDALREVMDKHDHSYSLGWFDTEFKNYLNYDIYSTPFDKERGYTIYKLANADVLCIRLEDLNRVYKGAFEEFLGLVNLTLVNKNKAESKVERELYKRLNASYRMNKERLEGVYSSKYMTHFYTRPEIDDFTRKWS